MARVRSDHVDVHFDVSICKVCARHPNEGNDSFRARGYREWGRRVDLVGCEGPEVVVKDSDGRQCPVGVACDPEMDRDPVALFLAKGFPSGDGRVVKGECTRSAQGHVAGSLGGLLAVGRRSERCESSEQRAESDGYLASCDCGVLSGGLLIDEPPEQREA
jgi:hypothetical protein